MALDIVDFSNTSTVSIAATTVTATAALVGSALGTGEVADALTVFNAGAVPVFITRAATATVGGMCIPPGAVMTFLRRGATDVSAITVAGVATVYFSLGKVG